MKKIVDRKPDLLQRFINTSATLMRIISHQSTITREEKLATALQFQALTYLHDHKNIPVGSLAHELRLSSSAAAQLVDRLIVSGRITRKHDKNDRRIVHISLTLEGKKELSQMAKKYIKKMKFVLSHIEETDLLLLIRIQRELIIKLEKNKPPSYESHN